MRSFLWCLALSAVFLGACSDDTTDTKSGAGASASSTTGGGEGGAGGSSGAGPTGPIDGMVQRYEYAFDMTTAQAASALRVDAAPPGGDCFSVACGLPVVDVSVDGAPALSAVVEGGMLTACGPGSGPGVRTFGASALVPEDTHLPGLDVGFSRTKDLGGGTFSYLLSWVGGCDHFGPCDDDPSRLVELRFDVTHEPGDTVLCPGARTEGDGKTTCEVAGTLAPTYSAFGIASDPAWVRSDFINAAGVNVVFYEVPGGPLAKALDAANVTSFFEWITGLLGPFPYGDELRFAGAPTAWFGFEHPANVILREDLPSYDGSAYADTTMHVLMHEVVHQWAGNRTTLASVADFVWKEAIAEYLAYVFEDGHLPPDEAAATLEYWDEISLGAKHHPRPTDDPTPPVEKFYGDVYGPGPMVLFVQIESMFGRDAVTSGIAAFLAEPGARSVEQLRDALEGTTGADLDAYFDAWVFGEGEPTWPTFEIETTQTGDQVTVTVTQVTPGGKLHGCAAEVLVAGATQSALAKVDFGPDPKSPSKSVTVTLAEPVTSVTFDPGHRLVGFEASSAAQERGRPRRRPMIF